MGGAEEEEEEGGSMISLGSSSLNATLGEKEEDHQIVYADFLKPTQSRKLQLVIGGVSLYVNKGWLSEISQYFAERLQDGIADEKIILDGSETMETFQEFFRCCFDCPVRKPIDDTNVAIILSISIAYRFVGMKIVCEQYLSKNINIFQEEELEAFIIAFAKYKPPRPKIFDRLVERVCAMFSLDRLEGMRGSMDVETLLDLVLKKSRLLAAELDKIKEAMAIEFSAEVARGVDPKIVARGVDPTLVTESIQRGKKRKAEDANVEGHGNVEGGVACHKCITTGRAPRHFVQLQCSICDRYRCSVDCKSKNSICHCSKKLKGDE